MLDRRDLTLADGRTLAVDDVGDQDGRAVAYLHGTPDSRLARHPDDAMAAAAGLRLLAVDRPGYGSSTATSSADPAAFVADLAALLDDRGIDRAAIVAWSGGALSGLAAAAAPALAPRITELHVVAGVVPRSAYDDADVKAATDQRLNLPDMVDGLSPRDVAEMVAPLLAPWPCDRALALEHQSDLRSAADQQALADIPGALDRMADALVEGVGHGLAGVQADIEAQAGPFDVDLGAIEVPVRLWYGTDDTVTPPAFGDWYARHLSHARADVRLTVVEGASHYLPFTHWQLLLDALSG
jgi:pimeloyl-ACP methyl ester carboxylesterase